MINAILEKRREGRSDPSTLKTAQIPLVDGCWMISPSHAQTYLTQMEGVTVEMAAKAAEGHEEEDSTYQIKDGVAVFALSDVMTKKPSSMSYMFGGTSTQMLTIAIKQAARDTSVKGGLLVIDSPGGQVQGTSDLVDAIAEFRRSKSMFAFIDGLAASAAYWAASACEKAYASRTSEIGCIGTYMRVVDSSEAAEKSGIKVMVIRDGEFKGMGTPGTPITDAQKKEMQRQVSDLNKHFVGDVAKNRGMSGDDAKALADGRVHVGEDAVKNGLIDGICSLDDCFAMIAARQSSAGTGENMAGQNGPTLGERIMALITGAGIDVGAAGGGVAAADETRLDPKVQAHLTGIAQKQAELAASAWADELIVAAKATKAEKESMTALFMDAISADGGGAPKFEAGVLFEGANLATVKQAYKARPAHCFLTQMVGEQGGGVFVLAENRQGEKFTMDRFKSLASGVNDEALNRAVAKAAKLGGG